MPYNPGVTDIRGQLLAQGINQAGDSLAGGIQEYRQNQQKDQAARGIVMGILSQNPDLVKSSGEETAKLLQKFKDHNTGKDDNVYLAGLLATAAKQKGEKQQQEMQSLQMQAAQQQMAEQARQQQFGKTLDQVNGGVGTGVLGAQMQNNPFFKQAAQLRQATGETPSAGVLAQLAAAQGSGMAKPQKAPLVEQSLPSGAKAAFSPDTGSFSVLPQSADQLAEIESSKSDAKAASDYVAGIPASAEAARGALPRINRIKGLYALGAQTGAGQDFLNQGGAYAARLGLIDPKKQANREEIQSALALDALQNAKALLTGSQSDADLKRIDALSANVGKSEAANKRIISFSEAASTRAIDLEAKRRELVEQNMPTRKVAEKLRQWQSDNPTQHYLDKIEDTEEEQAKIKSALPSGWKVN